MTATATVHLCKACWHVTDSDHCPGCGAGKHNRGANSPFLVGLTHDDIRGEMLRERDRVTAEARLVDWFGLDEEERAEARSLIGADDGYDSEPFHAGPWIREDYGTRTVTVGMWVTEKLGDDETDAWNIDEVVITIGEDS